MCFLSIIIPAHNEEARLSISLVQVLSFLQKQPYTSEVLVVENGSQDRTFAMATSFSSQYSNLRIIQEVQRGKGLAVQKGILEAKGEYRIFCDVDLSVPIEYIPNFLPPFCTADIAIASREAPGAKRYNEPLSRHIMGRFFNILVNGLVLPGFSDTQCGFKCFKKEVSEKIFNYQTLNGWSFDVEILFIAKMMGYSIFEVPVPWYYRSSSKINPMRDSLQMFSDILTIRRNAKRGLYDLRNDKVVQKHTL